MRRHPPRLPTALLERLLRREIADPVLGDLAEEHAERARRGAALAGVWYWSQCATVGGRLAGHRIRRAVRPVAWIRAAGIELRQARRTLVREPGLSALVVLAIALGVGLNTVFLGLARAAFLEPLPYPDARRLALMTMEFAGVNQGGFSVSFRDMQDVAAQADTIERLELFLDWQSVNLAGDAAPERVRASFVTPGYFDALGFAPRAGRLFSTGEDRPGAPALVAVLSHGSWQRVFGGRPGVLGRQILLNGQPFTVVGVLEPGTFDLSQRFEHRIDIYLPLSAAPRLTGLDIFERRASRFLFALTRLTGQATFDGARSELATIAGRLAQEYPDSNRGWSFRLRPLDEVLFEQVRPRAALLAGGALLVLLLICVNVTHLLLMQLAARTGELAIRRTLGATGGRLARQLVVEALCLAVLGGLLACVIAVWGVQALRGVEALALPGFAEVRLDALVVAGSMALVVFTGLTVGAIPAWRAARREPQLEASSGRHTGTGAARLRGALVGGEVALACVLLVQGGLLVASFRTLQATGVGFDADRLLSVRLDLRSSRYEAPDVVGRTAARLVEEAATLPGVVHAMLWSPSRLGGGNWVAFLTRPGEYDLDPVGRVEASRHHVFPGTFDKLGLPLVAGRDFEPADHERAPPVAVVSESLARLFWPGQNAVGRELETRRDGERLLLEVVGVAADARHRSRLDNPFGPQRDIYVPFRQWPERHLSVLMRLHPDIAAEAVAPPFRRRVLGIDPGLPVYDVQTMAQVMAQEEGRARVSALLVALYAGVALALAVLGVAGVLAHVVRQEHRDIGIRLALGATPGRIVRSVLGRGMEMVGAGLLAGMAASLVLSRTLSAVLFGVEPHDPAVLAGVPLLLALVALAACLIPARLAASVDPIEALRR